MIDGIKACLSLLIDPSYPLSHSPSLTHSPFTAANDYYIMTNPPRLFLILSPPLFLSPLSPLPLPLFNLRISLCLYTDFYPTSCYLFQIPGPVYYVLRNTVEYSALLTTPPILQCIHPQTSQHNNKYNPPFSQATSLLVSTYILVLITFNLELTKSLA